MLPVNLLNALKEYTLAQTLSQKTLPVAAADSVAKTGQQFELGQKLQGIVQAQVAPNVFKVNVSGQLVQMELPTSVSSGDTVALQVLSLQPRLTFSMVNSATPLSTPEQLGATSRMLSSMSQQAPEKAYVRATQSTPLWETSQPPDSKQLAGMLKEALSNSGLFYESHQAQWLGGERTTAQLMHEPQNLTPEQARAAVGTPLGKAAVAEEIAGKLVTLDEAVSTPAATGNTASKSMISGDSASKPVAENDTSGSSVATENATGKTIVASDNSSKAAMTWDAASKSAVANGNSNPAAITGNAADNNASKQPNPSPPPDSKSPGIPDHLQPLVQQQLNALETSQMIWQGNVWPGQTMQWEVHEQATQNQAVEGRRQWVTQIQLDLPNLGAVTATLRLNSAGLSLKLNAGTPQTRAVLGNASTQLVSSLSDAGIPVLSAHVTNEQPQ
jgi:hypothetical protein